MRLAGLIILASCAVLESYCASLAGENQDAAANNQANSSSAESRFRQLNSIEPFLQERARQQAGDQPSSQESISSLTNNLNLSAEPRARQLAPPYIRTANPYGQQVVPVPPPRYTYPLNTGYYQTSQSNYKRPIASHPPAYLPQAQPQPGGQILGQSAYGSRNTIELANAIYGQPGPKLPKFQEVIELDEPVIRRLTVKRGREKTVRIIVSFPQARKVRKFLGPERLLFHLEEKSFSHSPDKTVWPEQTHTTSKPEITSAKPDPQEDWSKDAKEEEKNENDSDEQEKSANDFEQEPEQSEQRKDQAGSSEVATTSETRPEPAEVDATAIESDGSTDGESRSEGEPQQATRQSEDEDEGSAKSGEADQTEPEEPSSKRDSGEQGEDKGQKSVASGDSEEEDEDKAQKGSATVKVDNLLESANKGVSELGEQSTRKNGQVSLAAQSPSMGLSLGESEAKLGGETKSDDKPTPATSASLSSSPSSPLKSPLEALTMSSAA